MLRLSAIGDVCHTLPVVRTLQHAWPATRLSWIIGRTEAGLVGDIPDIDFIVYDKQRGHQGLASLRQQLRGRQFDVLLQMQASFRAHFIGHMVRAGLRLRPERTGPLKAARLGATSRLHVMESLFAFSEALGLHERALRWDIPLRPADLAFAEQHIPTGRRALLISPCSSQRLRNYRNWPAERYAAVADYASERHGLQVVLTGGLTAQEAEYAQHIGALAQCAVTNLVGRTSLKQLLALIARATAVLAPDSGPVHMATAAGTPVIGLYASSNPLRTGPLDLRWTVNHYPEALLADCGRTVEQAAWGRRVRDPRAMERITVADVTAMLDRVMAEPRA